MIFVWNSYKPTRLTDIMILNALTIDALTLTYLLPHVGITAPLVKNVRPWMYLGSTRLFSIQNIRYGKGNIMFSNGDHLRTRMKFELYNNRH